MNQPPDSNPDQAFIDELNKREEARKVQDNNQNTLNAINKAGIKNVEATNRNTDSTATGLKNIKGQVKVTNPDLAKSQDVGAAVDAIHKLNMTTFSTNQGLPQLADNLVTLTNSVQTLQKDYETKGVSSLSKQLSILVSQLGDVSKTLSGTKVTIDTNLQKRIDGLQKAISGIDFKPTVNVASPDTRVVTTPVNFKPVLDALTSLEKAVNDNKPSNEQLDLSPVTEGLNAVMGSIQALRFPVPNYVLPFKDSTGKDAQITLNSDGSLPTSGGGSGGGGTQYTDGAAAPTHPIGTYPVFTSGGNVVAVSASNPLPITGTISVGSTTDESAFTAGTSTTGPVAGVFNDSVGTLSSGQQGTIRATTNRGLHTNLRNSGGTEIGTTTTPLTAQIADGTNTANVVAGDAGFNGVATASATKTYTFTTSASGAQTILANTPTEGFSWIEVVYTSVGSGLALTGQWSPISGGPYINVNSWFSSGTSIPTQSLGVANSTYYGSAIRGNFFQIAVSALTSGTFTGTVTFRATPLAQNSIVASSIQNGTWTVGSNSATGNAVPANAFYVALINASGNLTGMAGAAVNTDAYSGNQNLSVANWIYNGTTFDRMRSANSVATTTGTGLIGSGTMVFDGTNWQKVSSTNPMPSSLVAGASIIGKVSIDQTTLGTTNNVSLSGTTGAGTSNLLKDDTAFGDAVTTGILSVTNRLWNGTNYDRAYGDKTNGAFVNLKAIGGSTFSLGQQTAANSIPVILPSATITTLTQPTLQSGSTTAVTQVTASNLNATVTQGTAAVVSAGWPVIGGELADVTGTFTNATQTTSVTSTNFDGYSTVIVSINGTYATASGVFELSDDGGTTWYSVNAARSDGSAIETGYTTLTNTNRMWTLSVSGADQFRVRSTAVATGTANIRISTESMTTPEAASVSIPGNVSVIGSTVSGSSLTVAPITEGGLAKTANPTAVSDGQVVNATFDKLGKQVVVGSVRDLKANQVTTITSSTAETTIVTALASTFLDLYGIIITNTSATAVNVAIKDATSGTTRFNFAVPAGDSRGFMLPEGGAIKQAVVNNNWTATVSASVASVIITALTVQNL